MHVQVENIPGFADSPNVCQHTIPFSRKAQLLAGDLYSRFSSESMFKFEDVSALGPDTGAAAIAFVRHHGCLDCSSDVSKAIAAGSELQRGDKEGSLRAACDVATRMVAAEVGVEAWKLSRWMEVYADKPDGLVQHVTRSTPAY
jgi:alkylhydroperoxidase family enzyme